MKAFIVVAIGLMMGFTGYCQKYSVGLVRNGAKTENLEGQIIITDSTVVSNFNGQSSALKITGRKGYTIHVTDGTSADKYVVSLKAGRLHGYNYDHAITFHPDKRHSSNPPTVYMCVIVR